MEHTVTIKVVGGNYVYDPADLPIAANDTVVWKNDTTHTHTATADDGSFDTEDIPGGGSSDPEPFPTAPAVITYQCIYHAMGGTIRVS